MDDFNNKTYLLILSKLMAYFEENNFQTGDKLPPEDALAAQLYFGRPALREALRILEMLGVIESSRGRANIYVKNMNKGLLQFITVFANMYEDGFSGLSRLRADIEMIGVKSFIENADDIDIMELEFTAKKFLNERDDIMISCTDDSHHIKFHQLLVKYSAGEFEKNFITLIICSQFLSNVLGRVNAENLSVEELRKYKAERTHEDIISAIKERDVDKAMRVVRRHALYYADLCGDTD